MTFLAAFVMAASGLSGCKMLSQMPTTTWKLNRGPALDEGQGYFSIPDPPPISTGMMTYQQ